VILHILAAVSGSGLLWGVDFWSYLPPLWAYLLAGLGLVASVPSVGQAAFSFLSPKLERLFRFFEGRKSYLGALLISAAAGLLFWIFRCRIHLLGDGQLLIRNLDNGIKVSENEPLSLYLNWLVLKLFSFLNNMSDAREAFQITSLVSGIIFIFVVFWLARRMGRTLFERVLIFIVLITLGIVELFFGYVETYPPLNAAVIFYIFLAVRMLQDKGALFWPASAFLLSVLMHLSAMVMFPSLVFLGLEWLKYQKENRYGKVLKLVVNIFGPGAMIGLLMYAIGMDLGVLFSSDKSIANIIIPLVEEGSKEFNYHVMSIAHLTDLSNLVLLLAPFMVPLCSLLIWRMKYLSRVEWFLLVVSVFSLGFVVIFNPDLGFQRDWDIFAYAFIAPTLLGLSLFIEQAKEDMRFARYAAVLMVVVGGIHVVPWILVNADEKMSLARYEHILSGGSLHSVHARAFAYEEAAIYYRDRKLFEQAESHLKKALVIDKDFYRLYLSLAYIYKTQGKYDEAMEYYKTAVLLEPWSINANFNFALFLYDMNLIKESLNYFLKVIEIAPGHLSAHEYLGSVYIRLGEYRQAMESYRRILEDDPANENADYNLKNLKLLLELNPESSVVDSIP